MAASVVAIVLSALLTIAKAAGGEPRVPDFAYPRTVIRDADASLQVSMRRADWLAALRGVLERGVADAMVTDTAAIRTALLADSVGRLMPAPYSNLAWLIEATALSHAADISPRQIAGNLQKALEGADNFNAPIGSLGTLVEKSREVPPSMTVGDFLQVAAAELAFRSDCGLSSDSILASCSRHALERGDFKTSSWLAALAGSRMPQGEREDYLKRQIAERVATPWCAPLLAELYSDCFHMPTADQLEGKAAASWWNVYQEVSQYLNEYPAAYGAEALRYGLAVMALPGVEISTPRYMVPGDTLKTAALVSNITRGYMLLVKVPNPKAFTNLDAKEVFGAGSKVVEARKLGGVSPLPGVKRTTLEFKVPEAGSYVLVPSSGETLQGVSSSVRKSGDFPVVNAGLLSLIVSHDSRKASDSRVIAVRSTDQRPQPGVNISWYEWKGGQLMLNSRSVTGKDGSAPAPRGNFLAVACDGNSTYSTYVNNHAFRSTPYRDIRATILTDLPVYHPGDSVRAAVIAYVDTVGVYRSLRNVEVSLVLARPDGSEADTCRLKTDQWGRTQGAFLLPSEAPMGQWPLRVVIDGKDSGWSSAEVAAYRRPTFKARLWAADDGGMAAADSVLVLKGSAIAFTGVAEQGATVKCDVQPMPMWRRAPATGVAFQAETVCDEAGEFTIQIPLRQLKLSGWYPCRFRVTASVTSLSGETRTADSYVFTLGEDHDISVSLPSRIDVADAAACGKIRVGVKSLSGQPVNKEIDYRLYGQGDRVLSAGTVLSDAFRWPERLPAGPITMKVWLVSDSSINWEGKSVVYDPDSETVPSGQTLWLAAGEQTVARAEAESVSLGIGSSYRGQYIYVAVNGEEGLVCDRWVRATGRMQRVEVPAPAPGRRYAVTALAMHDFQTASGHTSIISAADTVWPKIESVSFRDRLTPASMEQWTFRVKMNGRTLGKAPVLAVMSDRSLQSVKNYRWGFNPAGSRHFSVSGYAEGAYTHPISAQWTLKPWPRLTFSLPGLPCFNLYGHSLGGNRGYRCFLNSSIKKMSATATVDEAKMESVEEYSAPAAAGMAVTDDAAYDSGLPENLSSYEYRGAEHPLAFFRPMLLSDSEGEVKIDFQVPDINGTWQLQLLSYSEDMKGTAAVYEAVSARPVSVTINAPRFLYTGDRAVVTAIASNTSGAPMPILGSMEVIDLSSGRSFATARFAPEEVGEGASRVMSIEISPNWPGDIAVRAMAEGGSHKDGESVRVKVLPAVAMQVESSPLWIDPVQTEGEATLRALRPEAECTFRLAANPVWECMEALPMAQSGKSADALSMARQIYGLSTALSLAESYPQLDSLKREAIASAPGVLSKAVATLAQLQDKEGGWSWCEGMEPSPYITGRVVELLGLTARSASLNDAMRKMADKGVAYCDGVIMKESAEAGRRYDWLCNLSYVCGRGELGRSSGANWQRVSDRTASAVRKDWKKLGITGKALAAVLMHRLGDRKLSAEIQISLLQSASRKAGRGIWFDTIGDGWSSVTPAEATAIVLDCLAECGAEESVLDGMRQWLLEGKLMQDWGSGASAVRIVAAVLKSGSRWPSSEVPFKVLVSEPGGWKEIELSSEQKLTGEVTMPLKVSDSDTLSVKVTKVSGSPAWGGIQAAYVVPLSQAKAHKCQQLSVEKRILAYDEAGHPTSVSKVGLKPGSRVRVELKLKSSMACDWLKMTDRRSACLEPADQLSGVVWQDGAQAFRSVGNDATVFYISHLPKGTTVFHYDCYIDRVGDYASGEVSVVSEMWPLVSADFPGEEIDVRRDSRP